MIISPATVSFAAWAAVLAYARTGGPLFYRAPLDLRPTRLIPATPGTPRVPYTYEARPRTIRIFPPGCIGRGTRRTADPFTADAAHLDRFSRPATSAEEAAARPAPATPPGAGEAIDLPALRVAMVTLTAHRELLANAAKHLGYPAMGPVWTEAALEHVLDDDYRSPETPGGS